MFRIVKTKLFPSKYDVYFNILKAMVRASDSRGYPEVVGDTSSTPTDGQLSFFSIFEQIIRRACSTGIDIEAKRCSNFVVEDPLGNTWTISYSTSVATWCILAFSLLLNLYFIGGKVLKCTKGPQPQKRSLPALGDSRGLQGSAAPVQCAADGSAEGSRTGTVGRRAAQAARAAIAAIQRHNKNKI